jgi:hypothetical protein
MTNYKSNNLSNYILTVLYLKESVKATKIKLKAIATKTANNYFL